MKSCAESRLEAGGTFNRIGFSRTYCPLLSRTKRSKPIAMPFKDTQFPSPPSGRHPGITYGILALEETQLSVRTPFLDNDLVRTVLRAPQSALRSNGVSLRLIADGNPVSCGGIPTDRGVAGNRGTDFRSNLPRTSRVPVQSRIRL